MCYHAKRQSKSTTRREARILHIIPLVTTVMASSSMGIVRKHIATARRVKEMITITSSRIKIGKRLRKMMGTTITSMKIRGQIILEKANSTPVKVKVTHIVDTMKNHMTSGLVEVEALIQENSITRPREDHHPKCLYSSTSSSV